MRDVWDDWVARTVLPVTLAETSVEVRDRNGTLTRAFDVEDGRVRLAVVSGAVDPTFTDMLITEWTTALCSALFGRRRRRARWCRGDQP